MQGCTRPFLLSFSKKVLWRNFVKLNFKTEYYATTRKHLTND